MGTAGYFILEASLITVEVLTVRVMVAAAFCQTRGVSGIQHYGV